MTTTLYGAHRPREAETSTAISATGDDYAQALVALRAQVPPGELLLYIAPYPVTTNTADTADTDAATTGD